MIPILQMRTSERSSKFSRNTQPVKGEGRSGFTPSPAVLEDRAAACSGCHPKLVTVLVGSGEQYSLLQKFWITSKCVFIPAFMTVSQILYLASVSDVPGLCLGYKDE